MCTRKRLLLVVLLLAGCRAEPGHLPGAEFDPTVRTRDPALLVSLLVSTTTPEASRKSADALLVEVKGKTDPTRLGVLEQILYASGHSDAMRIYALDQLAEADPGRAGSALVRYLPRFEGAVLAHACELAVKLGDPRLEDPLIRSLDGAIAGKAGDLKKERPEWKALPQLSGKSLEDTLYETVLRAPAPATRIAALDVLATQATPGAVLQRLKAGMATADGWLGDTCWWLETFGTLPRGENESAWIGWLHKPEQEALVARAAERRKLLAGPADLAPRHIHALAYAADSSVRTTRPELMAHLEKRLAALHHTRRTPDYQGSPEDVPDTLEAHAGTLKMGDLLAIDLLLSALENSANLQELQRLGLADLSDNTTEHGGLLAFINVQRPTLLITPYAPMYADNDFEYVTSDRLVRDTVQGVAEYHLHFQQIRNAARAGPGAGDLAYAQRTRCNCVVVTSTETRQMNVDFYTPDGAVVDLGTYDVPSP